STFPPASIASTGVSSASSERTAATRPRRFSISMGGFTKSKERCFPQRATPWRSASSSRSYSRGGCQTGPRTPIPGGVVEPIDTTQTLRQYQRTASAPTKVADAVAELTARTPAESHSNEVLRSRRADSANDLTLCAEPHHQRGGGLDQACG